MRVEEVVELVQHHASADAHHAFVGIKLENLPVIAGEIHDQAFADGSAAQPGACAARYDRYTGGQG